MFFFESLCYRCEEIVQLISLCKHLHAWWTYSVVLAVEGEARSSCLQCFDQCMWWIWSCCSSFWCFIRNDSRILRIERMQANSSWSCHSWSTHEDMYSGWPGVFYRLISFQKCKAENMLPILKIKFWEPFCCVGWSSSWGLQNASGVQYKRYSRSLHNCTEKL